MKFPIFASALLIFCIGLAIIMSLSKKKEQKIKQAYENREREADETRAKPLDDLQYIVIPDEVMNIFRQENGEFLEIVEGMPKSMADGIQSMMHLSTAKIVNLNNISNTDLKLTYGAANLNKLSEFDQNYVLLCRTLLEVGEYFVSLDNKDTAKLLYEYAVCSGSDSMATYKNLCDIYKEEQDATKINFLISNVSLLTGITKGPILKYLNEACSPDKDLEASILDILE